ncbi:TonB family protein [Marinagarivorans algicola]|uniref:TonB family protein n=1 Tax=Marinagarivorans algicola TaxID=1513270 RepID=UPI0006BA0B5F|nr:TonB family protein [Marinagarivorans algicola]
MQTLNLIPQRFTRVCDFILHRHCTKLRLRIKPYGIFTYATRPLLITCYLFVSALFANTSSAALNLNGAALHSELGKDQFIAGLYVEDLSKDSKEILLSNQRKRMEIKVLARRLLSRKFQRQWIEGVAINAGNSDLSKHAQNLADFSNMLKIKLIKNDTLTIERTFRRGVIVSINGVTLGVIKDNSFFDLLLRSWIGPVPLSSNFKKALLQAGSIESETLARFNGVRTTNERVSSLTEALVSKENTTATTNNTLKVTTTTTTTTNKTTNKTTTATPTTPSIAEAPAAVATTSAVIKNTATITDIITDAVDTSDTQEVLERNNSSEALQDTLVDKEIFDNDTLVATSNKEEAKLTADNSSQMIGNDIFDNEGDDFSYTAADLLSRQLYISKLTKWTGKTTKYPNSALRKSEQGTVRMTVTIDRKGKVIDQAITETSGVKSLDRAAQKAIRGASPYPAVPETITGDSFIFTVPIVFALRAQ